MYAVFPPEVFPNDATYFAMDAQNMSFGVTSEGRGAATEKVRLEISRLSRDLAEGIAIN